MFRIDGPDVAPALPPPAPVNAPGYFTEGDPALGIPATVMTGDFANTVQEELVAVATMRGAPLSKVNNGQCKEALRHSLALATPATQADPMPTGATPARRANLASDSCTADAGRTEAVNIASANCRAGGLSTANLASDDCEALGGAAGQEYDAANIASRFGKAHGDQSVTIASYVAKASGFKSAVIASGNALTKTVEAAGENSAAIATADPSDTRDAKVSGDRSALLGGARNDIAAGAHGCAIIASDDSDITSLAYGSSSDAAILACDDAMIDDSTKSAVLASVSSELYNVDGGLIGACEHGYLDGSYSVLLASSGAKLGDGYTVAGGMSALVGRIAGNSGLTWRIKSSNGNIYSDGVVGAGAADFAEMFENLELGALPAGSLVARQGRRVRLAQPGDRVLGVVSAAPAWLGNAAELAWTGRHVRDELGAAVLEAVEFVRWPEIAEKCVRVFEVVEVESGKPRVNRDVVLYDGPAEELPAELEGHAGAVAYRKITRKGYSGQLAAAPVPPPADAERFSIDLPKPSPSFDPSRPYTPRAQRPEEWTAVGLLGQLVARVDAGVEVDDDVVAGVDGIGTRWSGAELLARDGRAGKHRPLECLEIVSPYDEARGYALALCLVR